MAEGDGDVVADVLAPGLRVVFCGTRPSTVSALRKAYYAKPGNRFWPTLHAIGLTPAVFAPEQYGKLLPLGIGLTDIAKTSAGQDATMTNEDIDVRRLWISMRRYRPRILAFTSKTAAMHALADGSLKGRRTGGVPYGAQAAPVDGIEVHVLPSTSGLATSYWNIAPWQALAQRLSEMERQGGNGHASA